MYLSKALLSFTKGKLESINVIVIINGVVKDFFKTEADVIKEFGGIKNLANEINSPICKT